MHLLSCLRQIRILTILLPIAVLSGCGEGTGQQRIQNEPADPFSGPPASCAQFLTFEDICDQAFEFANFEGGVLTLIDNPQIDSGNGSAKVLQMQKFRATSGATFGGAVLDFSAVGSDTINAGDSYTIKIWSQRAVNVLFEPEGGGPGSGEEVAHGGTGWEVLTFTPSFSGTTSGFVFIFDNGTLGDAGDDPVNWTFYIDDISLPMGGDGGGPGDGGFPITFDDGASPAVTEFGGAGYAIEPGPSGGDGNALKIVRDGGEVFAGAWIAVPEIPNDAGDQTVSALVFSPTAGVPMVAKVEYGDNMGSGDVSANEPVVSGWQTLTWTFTNLAPPNVYNRFTILPNLGTVDSGVSYYFDNIDLVGSGGGGGDTTTLPVDFEGAAESYDFGPDGGFEGGAASVVTNPDQSGINTSAQVGQMLKFPGAVFGGATLAIESATVEAGSSFTMKVWSQRSVPVLLQPEPQGPGSGVEVVHGGTGWEDLTFSLPGLSGTVSGITIIFDNGTAGAADTDPDNWTFYFDDITLVAPDGGGGDGAIAVSDFEGAPTSYDFGPDGGFEGGAASVVTNPDQSGINTSAQVGQMLKFPGAVFGGATLALSSSLDVAAGSTFTMKVWSQRTVPVLFQPEPQGPGSGVEVMHGGTGWEELTFSFPSLSGTVTGITIIFDNGTAGAADTDPDNWTFYFDDITLIPPSGGGGGGSGATTLPVDFQGDINSYDFGPGGGFEGGAASVVTNPDQSGINTSTQVGQMLKFNGAVFGGATLAIEPTEVTAGSSFTMKVWSQRAVPVLLQPEPQGPGSGVEVTHGGTGWEELTFPLPALSGTVSGITIIFDNGTAGAAATDPTNWTFYFDDITLVPGGGGSGGATTLPVDFQADPASYDFGPDGGFEGGAASVVTNPDQSGINTSTQVGQMLKFNGAVFGGATLAIEPTEVTAGSSFTMKVWSQRAVPVLLQPEPQGPGSGVEVTHGGTGWEELTFPLPALSGTVSGITIIFDNGTAGAAATDPTNWTFYFDDITLVPGGGGSGGATTLPVDFQADPASYDFGPDGGFEGGAASVVTNPDQSGINTSTQVGQMLKFNGAVFGGATLAIESATVEAGSSFTMKVWSQRAVPVLLQPEPQGPGSGVEVTHGGTGWEELTFPLPALSGTVSGITIIFDNGTAGAAATDPTNWTFYFDDITLVPPDGGIDPVSVSDFEADQGSYDFGPDGGFEGGVSTVVTNPDQSGINTSAQVARMQKFPGAVFGGSTLQLSSPLEVVAGSTFTMKVWSQRTVPVLFQPEPQGPGSGVEVMHGGTGWEELTFSLPSLSGTVTGITVIFENGTAGAADTDPDNWTFYYDDIVLLPGDGGGGGSGATTLPVDFQGDINSYDFGPFGGFEGGAASVVTNPDQSGINTSTQVGQMLKYDGAVFGGATLAIESATVEAGSSFTMKVWSQRAVPVLLQPEPQGPGSGVEVMHGGTGWEELTFSLPSLSGTVTGITIIFDNGTAGAAATDPTNWTFYFDDITLVPPGSGGGGSGTVLVTFDEATPPEVNEFGGAIVTIDAAPAGGDGNALKVLRDGGQVWAGGWFVISGIPNDAGAQTLSARVYSPTAGVPMVAKLEYAENTGTGEVSANEAVVEGWQTLSWTFTNLAPPNDYNRFVILPNLGTVDTATSYFIDDITLVDTGGGGGGGGGDVTTLPVDFEGDINSYDFGPDGGFEGGAASVVTNPDQTGINTSSQVGQMLKFNGAVFGGATLVIEPVTVEAGSSFTMKVWSQRSVPVLLQPEPQGPGSGIEVTHGGTGWEELTFSLPGLSGTVSGITIIFDNGTAGAAATDPTNWTFYFDDITLVPGGGGGGGTGSGSLPVTFDEATPPAITEFGGAGYAIEAGPAGGDGKALKIVRDGGDVFAGAFVTVSGIPNDAGAQTISALVYSPTAGIPMVTKLEFGQNMGTGNVSANETVVVGWQTLTWTYTNLAAPNDYNRFVILPNLGTVDSGVSYYFDNIDLVGGGGGGGGGGTGDLVVDGGFEAAGTSGLQPPWFVFENGGTVSVSNVNDNGGDYSARLQADASAGTSFPILKIERVGTGSVTGGESVTISFDVIDVDTAGAGKTFVAELFAERSDPPGGATNEVILGGYDLTNSWQTRVFNTNLGADAAGGVSLLFKADCGGNTSCTMDVFIDNVSIVIN